MRSLRNTKQGLPQWSPALPTHHSSNPEEHHERIVANACIDVETQTTRASSDDPGGPPVLRPGGLFVASAVARDDSPEFGDLLDRRPSSFDAEEAVELVGGVFGNVDVTRWDAPLLLLPDRAAVVDYLVGRMVQRGRAEREAPGFATPMRVTKRGCLVWAAR